MILTYHNLILKPKTAVRKENRKEQRVKRSSATAAQRGEINCKIPPSCREIPARGLANNKF